MRKHGTLYDTVVQPPCNVMAWWAQKNVNEHVDGFKTCTWHVLIASRRAASFEQYIGPSSFFACLRHLRFLCCLPLASDLENSVSAHGRPSRGFHISLEFWYASSHGARITHQALETLTSRNFQPPEGLQPVDLSAFNP